MKTMFSLLSVVTGTDLPATMRAAALTKRPLDSKVHIEDFKEIEVKTPSDPGDEQVLIKVDGASVNPCEWKEIESPLVLAWKYPHVGGIDFGGTVVSVGTGVSHLKVGDAVWGMSSNEGAHAEFLLTDKTLVGRAPSAVTIQEASVMPLVALTNLLGFRVAEGPWVGANKTVVVLGGSGGTGHLAIQHAKAWGASKVVTTCGTDHLDFCKSQGADTVVDYHVSNWTDVVGPDSVDFVYDTVSADKTGNLAYGVLRDGGAYVCLLGSCLADDSVAKNRPSVKQAAIYLGSAGYTHEDLDVLKELVDAGALRPHVQKTFSLSEVDQLFSTIMAGHSVGKNSIVPVNSTVVI